MGSVKFNKQNNRLKRSLAGFDHYCGLIFYSNTLPTGFDVNNRMKEIADLAVAETLGITSDDASVNIKIMHYHIKELFRINPDAILFVGIFAVPVGAHTFSEVTTLRNFTAGKMRQLGVWTSKAYAVGDPGVLQGMYNDSFTEFAPVEILYSPNLDGVIDANVPDLVALADPNVHVLIAQDGGNLGKDLYVAADVFSVGVIGAALGATSLAKVHENIGWVEKFNMAEEGGELDVPALSNGSLVSALANNLTKSGGTLDTKRLIFIKKYPGITGSYFNDSHGACPPSSDFAYMEDNRAIDKAIRGIYANLLPKVNGPVLLDKTTGKLSQEYVTFLQLEAGKALEQMEKDGELSGFAVTIDPDQDVNATNKIVVNISNVKVGVSRNFDINIGY
jgi:hypothetical protein